MWYAKDSDFRDERQSRVYPRLAGCEDLENQNKMSQTEVDVIIPDLALLTDEEFEQRLITLRNEHQLTLELCDKLGLHEKQESNDIKGSLPIATVDDEYTLSTAAHADKSPARSPDFVHKSFKATKPPAYLRRTKSADLSVRRQLQEGLKPTDLEADEKDITEYKLKRYLDGLDYAKEVYSKSFRDKNGVPQHRCSDLVESMMESNKNMSRMKKSVWKHKVTIPKPFQMTVRETSKGSAKTKAQVFWEREKEKRDRKELEECQKRFKAAPVPANVYIPLYDELQKRKARQRSENHQIRQEFLLTNQNPFTFIEREKRMQMQRHEKMKMIEDADMMRPDANFQAKPFPKQLFSDTAYAKMRDEEEIRMLRMERRAEEMLKSSSLPKNMTKKRKNHVCEMSGEDDQHSRASDDEQQDTPEDRQERANRQKAERKYTQSRWPATHLGASPLSRSMTDLVESSATDSTDWKPTPKGARMRSAGRRRANFASSTFQQDPYEYQLDDAVHHEDFEGYGEHPHEYHFDDTAHHNDFQGYREQPFEHRVDDAVRHDDVTGYEEMNPGLNDYYDHDHQMHSDYLDRSYQCRPEQLRHGIA